MYKTVTTRRTYQISPFNGLEVIETTAEIPENLAGDERFSRLVHAQQLAEVELQHERYLRLMNELTQEAEPEEYLKALQSTAQRQINNYLQTGE